MLWLKTLKRDKEAWADFQAFIKLLDVETIQKYDAAKEYPEWLLAKGSREFLFSLKLRFMTEEKR